MKLFTGLYEKVMEWSKHPHASYYLGALSFAESSFFPIPPDVMLAPMSVARPNQAWWTRCAVIRASDARLERGFWSRRRN